MGSKTSLNVIVNHSPLGLHEDEKTQKIKEYEAIAPTLIHIKKIVKKEPFLSMFLAKDEVYETIKESIKINQFDWSFPVLIWKDEGEYTLIDGHRRILACEELGVEKIPARILSFSSEGEAYQYALDVQLKRRNLKEKDLFLIFLNYDFKKESVLDREKVANIFGFSQTTAQRYMTVKKEGEGFHKKILDGEMSVIKAYESIQENRNKAQKTKKNTFVKKRDVMNLCYKFFNLLQESTEAYFPVVWEDLFKDLIKKNKITQEEASAFMEQNFDIH